MKRKQQKKLLKSKNYVYEHAIDSVRDDDVMVEVGINGIHKIGTGLG